MKSKNRKHTLKPGKLTFIGLGIAAFWWTMESVLMSTVFRDGSFIEQMLSPDMHELWMRMLTLCVIIAFALYAQATLNLRKRFEESLRESNEKLEMRVRERTVELEKVNDILQVEIDERKKVAERVNFLAEVLETSPISVIATDANGSIRYVNPATEVLYGYESEELLGENPIIFNAEPDKAEIQKEIFDTIRVNQVWTGQLLNSRKNGDLFHIQASVYQLQDEKGDFMALVGFQEDITERKQAEKQLRDREEYFRSLIEYSSDGIVILDKYGTLCYESPSLVRLLGVKPEERIGMNSFEFVHPDDLEKAGNVFDQLIRSNSYTLCTEVRGRHRDGSWRTFQVVGRNLLDDPRIKGIVANVCDITERKHAEEELNKYHHHLEEMVEERTNELNNANEQLQGEIAERKRIERSLRQQEQYFRSLIENSLEVILVVNSDGTIRYTSPSLGTVTGFTSSEQENHSVFELIHPDDLPDATGHFRQLVKDSGSTVFIEIRARYKDGSWHFAEASGQNLLDDVAVRGIVINFRDVTERKRTEEKQRELYEQEKELRQQLEAEITKRVEFTRTLTHELKTPLTSVLASSDLLVSELKDATLLNLARGINRSASNLNSRIDELLDLARGEIGMLELKLEPVDISLLLRETADSTAPLASKREQSLILDVPPVLPLIRADTVRLQQVVTNLLGNAIKFTPKGGRITLRARQENSALIVEVQDTGRGMSREEQKRLFEPYHRFQNDKERLSGLGLGLALCKALVELHGGQIWVKSRSGRGSTFSFSLPLDSEVAGQQATEPKKASKSWKVLIIEDDREIVNFVDLAFQMRWPEAQLVSTDLGEEGVEMVETEAPDVVILDLGLPDISGLEVLRQVRLFSAVPVIVLSVRAEEADIAKGLELGADDYMVKPFKQLELLARLKVQLRKKTTAEADAPIVCGLMRLDPSTFQLTYDGNDIDLTIIEGHIMHCLMRNAGRVVTHSRLAEAVWGDDYTGVIQSLRVNIQRLRAKLEEEPGSPKLIITKPGIGYSLAKPV